MMCHITASLSPPLTCEITVLLLIANWMCYRPENALYIFLAHSLAHDKTNAASHTLSVFSLCQSIDVDGLIESAFEKIYFRKKSWLKMENINDYRENDDESSDDDADSYCSNG